jgi:hypothetical protein
MRRFPSFNGCVFLDASPYVLGIWLSWWEFRKRLYVFLKAMCRVAEKCASSTTASEAERKEYSLPFPIVVNFSILLYET